MNLPDPQSKTPTRPKHVIGLCTDADDGHTRITRGRSFEVLMGSEQTHEEMQRICLEIERRADALGLSVGELTKDEFLALIEGI